MSLDAHRARASTLGTFAFALVTVSDTRDASTDLNGPWLAREVEDQGGRVSFQCIVPDEAAEIDAALDRALSVGSQAVVFNGGTGFAPRDTTVDVVSRRFSAAMPGFGELFRLLSFQEIGSAAMLSRACAGIVEGAACFCIPGSHNAVRLAWDRLIGPEIGHLLAELARRPSVPTRPEGTD